MTVSLVKTDAKHMHTFSAVQTFHDFCLVIINFYLFSFPKGNLYVEFLDSLCTTCMYLKYFTRNKERNEGKKIISLIK